MDLESLVVRLKGNADHYRKMLRGAEIQTKRFSLRNRKSIQELGDKMAGMGRTLTTRVTLPLIGMGAAATKAFADFDKAMTESMSIMGDLSRETKGRMRDLALDLSTQSTKGPQELAKSYYFLASAGLSAQESMGKLPTVIRFATAGAFDMERATDLLTDAQTALGDVLSENGKDMKDLGDHITLAARQANASVEQFAEAITSDAGVAARNFKMQIETLSGVLGAYASAGKKGAEAGNMLGRSLRLLRKSYKGNAETFEKHGIEVVDKATGEYNNFIDIIKDMEEAMAGMTGPQMSKFLSDLGFKALAQKAILPLIGMSDAMEKWEEAQKDAAGTMESVYQKQLKAFTNQMKMAWNQIKVAAIQVGKTLAPMILKMVDKLKGAVEWWSNLSDGAREAIVKIGVLLAAGGPLMMGIGKLTSSLSFLMSGTVASKAGLVGGAIVGIGLLTKSIYEANEGVQKLNAELSRAADLDAKIEAGQKERRAERKSKFEEQMSKAGPKEQLKLLEDQYKNYKQQSQQQRRMYEHARHQYRVEAGREKESGAPTGPGSLARLGGEMKELFGHKPTQIAKEQMLEAEEELDRISDRREELYKRMQQQKKSLPTLMKQHQAKEAAGAAANMTSAIEQWDTFKDKAKEVITDISWDWSYFTDDLGKGIADAFGKAKEYGKDMLKKAGQPGPAPPSYMANEVVMAGTSQSRQLMQRTARLAAKPEDKKDPAVEVGKKQLGVQQQMLEALQETANPVGGLTDLFEMANLGS